MKLSEFQKTNNRVYNSYKPKGVQYRITQTTAELHHNVQLRVRETNVRYGADAGTRDAKAPKRTRDAESPLKIRRSIVRREARRRLRTERDARTRAKRARAVKREGKLRRRYVKYWANYFERKAGPPWYQELSPGQLSSADGLRECLKHDHKHGTVGETRDKLVAMGVVVKLSAETLRGLISSFYYNPEMFLLEIYQYMNPNGTAYSVNDRIVLSAIVHLTIRDIFKELHIRIPSPEGRTIGKCGRRRPVPKETKENTRCASPYVQPFPFVPQLPRKRFGNARATRPASPYFGYAMEPNGKPCVYVESPLRLKRRKRKPVVAYYVNTEIDCGRLAAALNGRESVTLNITVVGDETIEMSQQFWPYDKKFGDLVKKRTTERSLNGTLEGKCHHSEIITVSTRILNFRDYKYRNDSMQNFYGGSYKSKRTDEYTDKNNDEITNGCCCVDENNTEPNCTDLCNCTDCPVLRNSNTSDSNTINECEVPNTVETSTELHLKECDTITVRAHFEELEQDDLVKCTITRDPKLKRAPERTERSNAPDMNVECNKITCMQLRLLKCESMLNEYKIKHDKCKKLLNDFIDDIINKNDETSCSTVSAISSGLFDRLEDKSEFKHRPTKHPDRRRFYVKEFPKKRSQQMKLLKKALRSMKNDGFLLPQFPACWMLPHFRVWLDMRSKRFITLKDRERLNLISEKHWAMMHYASRSSGEPRMKLPADEMNNADWGKVKKYKTMIAKAKMQFYRKLKQNYVTESRDIFFTMMHHELPTKTFPDCFFAYMHSDENHVFPYRPWLTEEKRNMRFAST